MSWKIEIASVGAGYKWKLFNRAGDLVMVSRETYPTQPGAMAAAEYEQLALRELQLAA